MSGSSKNYRLVYCGYQKKKNLNRIVVTIPLFLLENKKYLEYLYFRILSLFDYQKLISRSNP